MLQFVFTLAEKYSLLLIHLSYFVFEISTADKRYSSVIR